MWVGHGGGFEFGVDFGFDFGVGCRVWFASVRVGGVARPAWKILFGEGREAKQRRSQWLLLRSFVYCCRVRVQIVGNCTGIGMCRKDNE